MNIFNIMVDKDSAASIEKNGENAGHSYTDQEREWAQAALAEFNRGNYATCLQNLAKLETSCGQDVKLVHNKAVAEYFRSELRRNDQFKKILHTVSSQVCHA